jgi:hypothetical protein
VRVDPSAWFGALAIGVLLAVLTVGALAVTRRRWLSALLVAAGTGGGSAFAAMAVALADGWAITHGPVQVLVVALVVVGGIVGWIVGTRRTLPLLVAAASILSFGITVQLVDTVLYPPTPMGLAGAVATAGRR